ncbi:MAG: LbtU family siderophore porin, partial [Gammaproteobacteria bacterium]
GKQYVQFGDYERFAMTKSFTQLMTETHGTAATLGFVDASGFNAAAYVLRGNQKVSNAEGNVNPENPTTNPTTLLQNFGLNVGMANSTDRVAYKVSAGYLSNMADIDYISNVLGPNKPAGSFAQGGYTKAVGALTVDGKISSGAFDANAHYVTALQEFHASDLVFKNASNSAAKPSAWALEAGYSFKTMAHDSRVSLGYQRTKQAGGFAGPDKAGSLALPESRWIGSYKVNVSKHADVGVEVYNDRDYGVNNGGTDKNVTVGVLRLGVKFS